MKKAILAVALAASATTSLAGPMGDFNREPYTELSEKRQEQIQDFMADYSKVMIMCGASMLGGITWGVGSSCGAFIFENDIDRAKYWYTLTKGQSHRKQLKKAATGSAAAGWLPFVGTGVSGKVIAEMTDARLFIQNKYGLRYDTNTSTMKTVGVDGTFDTPPLEEVQIKVVDLK